MTTRDDLDRTVSPELGRLLSAWFEADAQVREPEDLLARTLIRTARTRHRPAWQLPERWLPMQLTMRRFVLPAPARYVVVVAIVLLALALAVVVAGSFHRVPRPFGPAANGLIPAVAAGDIVTVDPVTGVTKTVVGGTETDSSPFFSRDGTRIAFVRSLSGGAAVFAVAASGGDPVRLTPAPLAPVAGIAWSADGSSLAVHSADVLWIAKTDGSGAVKLDLGDVTVIDMAWRPPNGAELIVAGQQSGVGRLFAVKPDGSGLRRISSFEGGDGDFQWLSPSPDGTQIAYGTFPSKVLHVVTIDAELDEVITPDDGVGLNFPRWSPDGTRIAVLHVPEIGQVRLAVIASNDSTPHITLTGPEFGTSGVQFEWAPDGNSIVAVQWGSDVPWLLDPAGGPGQRMSWTIPNPDWIDWQRLATG